MKLENSFLFLRGAKISVISISQRFVDHFVAIVLVCTASQTALASQNHLASFCFAKQQLEKHIAKRYSVLFSNKIILQNFLTHFDAMKAVCKNQQEAILLKVRLVQRSTALHGQNCPLMLL